MRFPELSIFQLGGLKPFPEAKFSVGRPMAPMPEGAMITPQGLCV
jgi:hypothetical protein